MSDIYIKDVRESEQLSKSIFDKKPRVGWTPSFRDKMRAWELYTKGCTDQEISRDLGISYNQFKKFVLEFKRFFEQMKRRRPQDLPRAPRRDSPTEGNPLLTAQAIRLYALAGFNKQKIADLIGVSHQAIANYFTRHPELEKIFLSFGELADAKVIYSLLQRAQGMRIKKTKFATFEGAITDSRDYFEELPPSVEAAMHWLVNRKRWKKSDAAVLTSNKGEILEALENMTQLTDEEMDRLDREHGLDI